MHDNFEQTIEPVRKEQGSEIQPAVHFENDRAVAVLQERCVEVIVGVHQEQVAHGFIAPL